MTGCGTPPLVIALLVIGLLTAIAAGLPVIFAAYVISCGLRIAQGSATAAIAATAGIIGPTTKEVGYSQPQLALIAAATAPVRSSRRT